ncbi:hypothetical protein AGMMS4952_21150 [Spirochaetia bacterium]|nr:hypothetical protein AGMMS4952_21150 [Spirochaetia bacterium]
MPKKKSVARTQKVSVKKVAARVNKTTRTNAMPVAAAKTAAKTSGFLLGLYWVIIVVFVSTTCYLLGIYDHKKTIQAAAKAADNVQIIEETSAESTRAANEYLKAGQDKLINGDTDAAIQAFGAAISRAPTELAYTYRGEAYLQSGNYPAAINDFDAVIANNSNSSVAFYDRALANIKLENLDVAKNDLTNALAAYQINPITAVNLHDLYSKRAQLSLWLKQWSDAVADYTSAIAEGTKEASAWEDYTGRAEARTNMGDYQNAVSDYVSAITVISEQIQNVRDESARESMSRQAMGYFEKSGALRVKMGQTDLAKADLEAAYTLALALDDIENLNRLQILISNIK